MCASYVLNVSVQKCIQAKLVLNLKLESLKMGHVTKSWYSMDEVFVHGWIAQNDGKALMESLLGATHMVEVGVMMLLQAFFLGKNMIFIHPINVFVHLKKSLCISYFLRSWKIKRKCNTPCLVTFFHDNNDVVPSI